MGPRDRCGRVRKISPPPGYTYFLFPEFPLLFSTFYTFSVLLPSPWLVPMSFCCTTQISVLPAGFFLVLSLYFIRNYMS
jgi:hypothetical protein